MPRARTKSPKRKSKSPKRTKSKNRTKSKSPKRAQRKKVNPFHTVAQLKRMSTKEVQNYRDRVLTLLTHPPAFVYEGKKGADFYYGLQLAQSHALKELLRRQRRRA